MEFVLPGFLFIKTDGKLRREKKRAPGAADRVKEEKRLFCAQCRNPVTRQDERIPVNGAHEHTCTNPHGFTFRIGCFREANGCAALGEATPEHTWFAGYAWKVALCANCGVQLGWRYQAADRFHGLILDRLTSAPADGS